MKIYTLTIAYDEDKEEVEYMSEEIAVEDESVVVNDYGIIDITDYFDEEGLKLVSGCYIIGEA